MAECRLFAIPGYQGAQIFNFYFRFFSYVTEEQNSNRGIQCGSVIISDRFAIFAAHCFAEFGTPSSEQKTTTIIIRDGTKYQEKINVRRILIHPDYKFPSLYSDIALVEFARRIEYDYDKFGDSPSCFGTGKNLDGRLAITEGYGFTEHGEKKEYFAMPRIVQTLKSVTFTCGSSILKLIACFWCFSSSIGSTSSFLLTTNVTIINNSDCAEYLRTNTTGKSLNIARLKSALPMGINDQLLCSTGIEDKDNIGAFSVRNFYSDSHLLSKGKGKMLANVKMHVKMLKCHLCR